MHISRLSLSILLAIAYNFLFWEEKLGLNLPIFTLLMIGIGYACNPQSWKKTNILLVAIGTLFSGLFVVLHNSGTSKVIHLLSGLLFLGMVHEPSLRSIGHGFAQSILAAISSVNNLLTSLVYMYKNSIPLTKIGRFVKLGIIPLGILLVFFGLFFFANPVLASYSFQLGDKLAAWIANMSLLRALFFLSGILIASLAVYPLTIKTLVQHDALSKDQLARSRRQHKHEFSPLALKREYLVGVLLVGMVNGLLLVNNIIDIQWLWFDFDVPRGVSLTQLVHEGSYLLIISILLSMGIMLYFYRGNQNFYRKGRLLRLLTYAWIAQNFLLVISVGIRNYHYIAYHGLAYKRIGVIFFLILVLVGLVSLAFKIRDRMSTYYLFKLNSWSVYLVGLLLCTINWDVYITRYNIDHFLVTGRMDWEYLEQMSPRVLPLLISHEREIILWNNSHSIPHTYYPNSLHERRRNYVEEVEDRSWRSWNYADYKAVKWLTGYEASLTNLR